MDLDFHPVVPQFKLTHIDGDALPTVNPAYDTPLISGGRLAFLPRDLYRWLPDSDGSVFLALDGPDGANLGGIAGDYLEVGPGLYTLPVPIDSRRPPRWKATVSDDWVRVERRFADHSPDGLAPEPWYWSRVRTLDFVRVPEMLRWPRVGFVDPWWLTRREGGAGAA